MTKLLDPILLASVQRRAAGTTPPANVAGRRPIPLRSGLAHVRRWTTALMMTMASGASTAVVPQPLQPMTLDQVMEAGAAGTGCSWSLPTDRRMRFAAAGDRAAVRLDGRTIVLSPAPGAPELFPFTFAEWQAEGVTIGVREVGRAQRLNTEALTVRATLTVTVRGSARRMDGRMSCGS